MAQLLDVVPPLPPHAGALPILKWETHLVRAAAPGPEHLLHVNHAFCERCQCSGRCRDGFSVGVCRPRCRNTLHSHVCLAQVVCSRDGLFCLAAMGGFDTCRCDKQHRV